MNDDQNPFEPNADAGSAGTGAEAQNNGFESGIFFAVVAFVGALAIVAALLLLPASKRQAAQVKNEGPALLEVESQLDHPRPLADFALTNSLGQRVARANLLGNFLVVNFVFTSCALGCPSDTRMKEIQRLVAGMPDVRLLSLATDPRSDTPEALAKFARQLKADTNRWTFLTGDKPSLYGLIESSFMKPSPELMGALPGGFDCAERIMLVDRQGNVSDSFNAMRRSAATNVVSRINTLRSKSLSP